MNLTYQKKNNMQKIPSLKIPLKRFTTQEHLEKYSQANEYEEMASRAIYRVYLKNKTDKELALWVNREIKLFSNNVIDCWHTWNRTLYRKNCTIMENDNYIRFALYRQIGVEFVICDTYEEKLKQKTLYFQQYNLC